jgi:hypothetical protein
MHGSLLFFSPDGITHRIDGEHPDRRRLVAYLTDSVPLGCRIGGIILEQAAAPLSAVANTTMPGVQLPLTSPHRRTLSAVRSPQTA